MKKNMTRNKNNALYAMLLAPVFLFSGCTTDDTIDSENVSYLNDYNRALSVEEIKISDKVIVEEFSDIECPACKGFAPTYEKLAQAFEGNENVEFRYNHYPLEQIHRYAYPAALGSECAGVVGGENARDSYIHLAFAEDQLSTDFLRNLREDSSLNFSEAEQTEFLECFNNKKTSDIIKNNKAEGEERGLKGTPTVYINGEEYAGTRTYDALFLEINSKLK